MAITWTDVLNIAPELSVVTSGARSAILADVALQLDSAVWGTKYDMASKYLAAHIGSMSLRTGAALGPVVSESVGSVSRTYQPAYGSDAYYSNTSYGQEFKRLCRQLPAGRMLVT